MAWITDLGNAYDAALQNAANQIGISMNLLVFIMTIVSVWTLVWKGLALWKASQKNQKIIFVLLLILNDIGIVELVYYFWLSKIEVKNKDSKAKTKKK